MSLANINLIKLSKNLIFDVYPMLKSKFGSFIDEKKLKQELALRLENNAEFFQKMENDIDINILCDFLNEPQISDLIFTYFQFILTHNIAKIEESLPIKQGSIINYCIKVIEKHFFELRENNKAILIRKYFEILFDVCTQSLLIEQISREDFDKDDAYLFDSFITTHLKDTKYFDALCAKMRATLESDFISSNTEYDNKKNEYTKSIQQLFQKSFVYMIGDCKFNDFYIPPILLNDNKLNRYFRYIFSHETKHIYAYREGWRNLFEDSNIVYVIGGAGYGKSLFLKNIINNYSSLCFNKSCEYLIIYCDLKTYYTKGNDNKKTIIDFLQESMINLTGLDNISKEMIQHFLKIGRCIILLDALDEVTKDVRVDFHKKLVTYFSSQHPNNKVCITSRARGFVPQQKVEVKEIYPLLEQDISDYIDKMIKINQFKRSEKENFMKQAKVLIEKEFLNNFLILSLMVKIYKSEKTLPENKIKLYEKCFDYIARIRETQNTETGYDWKNIERIIKDSTFISLSVLAAPNNRDIPRKEIEECLVSQYKNKYIDEITTENAIKEFLDFCANRTELFVLSPVDDHFKFFHRSFFEYFYAKYINQQSEVSKMYELMEKFDVDSEIFELTIALVKEENEEKYQQLVEYIFEKAKRQFENEKREHSAFSILTLCMRVVDDARYIMQYFDCLINYADVITQRRKLLNQSIISSLVEKTIEENEERKSAFFECYRAHCLCYFLELFCSFNKSNNTLSNDVFYVDNIKTYSTKKTEQYILRTKTPYYICLFSTNDELFAFLEGELSKSFENLWKSMEKQIPKSRKKSLKGGYYAYKKMSREDKENFSKLIITAAKNVYYNKHNAK